MLPSLPSFVCFNETATTEIYTYEHTLSLHGALPIYPSCPIRDADLLRLASLHAAIMVQFLSESLGQLQWNPSHRTRRIKDMFFLLSHSPLSLIRDRSNPQQRIRIFFQTYPLRESFRSEEHTSELQSLMRISYAVFCLKKKITT